MKPDYKPLEPASHDPHIYFNHGLSLLQLGKIEEAKEDILSAIKINPNNAEYYIALGNIAKRENELSQALVYFQKALVLQPNHAEVHNHLGILYYQSEDFDKALYHYAQATHLKPDYVHAHFNLGLLFVKQGKIQFAIRQFTNVSELIPDFLPALKYLAELYWQEQDARKAIHYYQAALHVDASDFDVNYNLGVAAMTTGQLALAKEQFEKIIQLNHRHIDAMINCAAVYLKLNEESHAINTYKQILSVQADHPIATYMLHALEGTEVPAAAPIEYTENLFDHYAKDYDTQMKQILRYQLPELIEDALMPYLTEKKDILDLGCGSGLIGAMLQPYRPKIIGIDLSSRMLDVAKHKQCYDQLIHADLIKGMCELTQQFDFIIAADVFVYIGDLSSVFTEVKKLLKPKGLFCFSTEIASAGYQLQVSARYAHAPSYIHTLAEENGFEMMKGEEVILRYQNDQPVVGRLYLLNQKSL